MVKCFGAVVKCFGAVVKCDGAVVKCFGAGPLLKRPQNVIGKNGFRSRFDPFARSTRKNMHCLYVSTYVEVERADSS